jgi:WD40 repeat protein
MAARASHLISGDLSGVLCFWDFGPPGTSLFETTGRCNHHLISESRPHADAVWSIAAHEQVPFVVTASADGSIGFHSCEDFDSEVRPLVGGPACVCFFDAGQGFAVGCGSGLVVQFATESREETARFKLPVGVAAMAGLGPRFAAGLEDGSVRICVGGAVERSVAASERPIAAVAGFAGDGLFVATGGDGEVRVFSLATGEPVHTEQQSKEKAGEGGLAIAVTPLAHQAQMFAVAGADGVVKVFGPK